MSGGIPEVMVLGPKDAAVWETVLGLWTEMDGSDGSEELLLELFDSEFEVLIQSFPVPNKARARKILKMKRKSQQAQDSSSSGGGTAATLESLLDADHLDAGVLRRMKSRFHGQVRLAWELGDKQLAIDTYNEAAALPSSQTELHYERQGYIAIGPLFDGSGLVVYYKVSDLTKHVLKSLDKSEARRLVALQEVKPAHASIITFELWTDEAKDKSFMLMPALSGTLETIAQLPDAFIVRFWKQMSSALSYLHSLGFSHGDVKPSNIGVESGNFILIDLGSVSKFGQRTSSTPAYIPCDKYKGNLRSSEALDWWMLCVTLAEKGCGNNGLEVGVKATTEPLQKILDHLQNHMQPSLWKCVKDQVSKYLTDDNP